MTWWGSVVRIHLRLPLQSLPLNLLVPSKISPIATKVMRKWMRSTSSTDSPGANQNRLTPVSLARRAAGRTPAVIHLRLPLQSLPLNLLVPSKISPIATKIMRKWMRSTSSTDSPGANQNRLTSVSLARRAAGRTPAVIHLRLPLQSLPLNLLVPNKISPIAIKIMRKWMRSTGSTGSPGANQNRLTSVSLARREWCNGDEISDISSWLF